MWHDLDEQKRFEYKKMILAFASLTEMFAQKAESNENETSQENLPTLLSPFINSKYQETVFRKVFNSAVEDIGNTPYDASLKISSSDERFIKYLIGIKTFGINSGAQKVAQFKARHDDWSVYFEKMNANALNDDLTRKTKAEIDIANNDLYFELAREISRLRNDKLCSAEAEINGFESDSTETKAVYHVLMPSKKGTTPTIYVGETSYDPIDIPNIQILGCTMSNKPTNFEFTDGKHKYKFTSADSQLYMHFENNNIIKEYWPVTYADNAYDIFSEIADKLAIAKPQQERLESYSWLISSDHGEVPQFSGFNAFHGVGSKAAVKQRERIINNLPTLTSDPYIIEEVKRFINTKANSYPEKHKKAEWRLNILNYVDQLGDINLKESLEKILYRSSSEMYIPIPDSVAFHQSHPDFFRPGAGELKKDGYVWKLVKQKEDRKFTMVFEPSGDELEMFITQDNGKAIESYSKQSILGDWLLEKIFYLKKYTPLTKQRLDEMEKNGIRLSKKYDPSSGNHKIHLSFIWIDENNLPDDFISFQ